MKEKKYFHYNFDYKSEYKEYRTIGKNSSKIKNYIMWKDGVINKYHCICESDFFENMLRYLNKIMCRYKNSKTVLSILVIPAFVLLITICLSIPTFIIGLGQYTDSLLSDINTAKSNLSIAFSQYEDLKDRSDYLRMVGNGSYNIIFIVVTVVIIYSILAWLIFMNIQRKIDFLSDYKEVIELVALQNQIDKNSIYDNRKKGIRYNKRIKIIRKMERINTTNR